MKYAGTETEAEQRLDKPQSPKPRILGARRLFEKKRSGSPGKLGKSSTKAESLSKLRGKGALA